MKDDQDTERTKPPRDSSGEARATSMGWVPYLALCATGLIIALTSIGPSASEGLGTLNTMVFWTAHVIPAIALLAVTQMALGRIERLNALPGIWQVVLSAIVAAFLFAPIALGIDGILAGPAARDVTDESIFILLGSELGHFFLPFVLIWTLINAPSLTQLERAGFRSAAQPVLVQTDAPHVSEDTTESAEFWSKIPGRLGRNLIALSAELHYLRVYTTLGDTLILYSFGRAVDLLQSENGMQVHRSHWVSLDHIDEVTTRNGRTTCSMVNGPSLPVSRSYRSALKAARRGAI